jgi:hypothetical protein
LGPGEENVFDQERLPINMPAAKEFAKLRGVKRLSQQWPKSIFKIPPQKRHTQNNITKKKKFQKRKKTVDESGSDTE